MSKWASWSRRMLYFGVAGTLVAVCLGCANSASTKEPTPKLEKSTLRISYIPIPPAVPFHIALTRGFFKAEGLNVVPQIAPTAATSSQRLRSGQSDIIFDSNVQLLLVHDAGFPVNLVAENDLVPQNGLYISTIRPDIDAVSDFKGKKIGFDGAVIRLLTTILVEAHGLNVKRDKIEFVEIPLPKMPEALLKGQVDAGFLDAAFLDAMEAKGSRRILNLAQGPTSSFPATAYATSAKFAKENPRTVAAFNRAIVRAQTLANRDIDAYAASMAKMANISKQQAFFTAPGVGYQYTTNTNVIRLQRVPDQMFRFGFLKKRINIKDLVAPSIPVAGTTLRAPS
jgi:NitT/TauT family transport system substrate-binding protein